MLAGEGWVAFRDVPGLALCASKLRLGVPPKSKIQDMNGRGPGTLRLTKRALVLPQCFPR